MTHSRLRCAGCGWTMAGARERPFPFHCERRRAGDDIDHILVRTLDAEAIPPPTADPNPFVSYRHRLHSYHVARSLGIAEDEYVGLVRRLDTAIAELDGHGFLVTPWLRCGGLSEELGFSATGGIWVKDETGNVSGSHKGRHLVGIMLYLEVLERLGVASAAGRRTLAIASCGNAALAAAVVARAAEWPLDVFVPPSADPSILAQLRELGAHVSVCDRRAGESGDPSYLRFQEAVSSGALPFSVQGSENGLTIEGGETLAWEIIDALGGTQLDRLIVQVGGGALASACVQAFSEAFASRAIRRMPRVHAVQTEGGYPLARAFDLVSKRIRTQATADRAAIHEAMRFARTHRSQFMWPWETEPRSIAHGILDDETYDWAAVVEGMLLTGGGPIVVGEKTLEAANALACGATGVNVDHTGSAGLAGLLELQSGSDWPAPDERVAVIFSGARRTNVDTPSDHAGRDTQA